MQKRQRFAGAVDQPKLSAGPGRHRDGVAVIETHEADKDNRRLRWWRCFNCVLHGCGVGDLQETEDEGGIGNEEQGRC